jgi:hypothetical protein
MVKRRSYTVGRQSCLRMQKEHHMRKTAFDLTSFLAHCIGLVLMTAVVAAATIAATTLLCLVLS